jgi:hypothetical protein
LDRRHTDHGLFERAPGTLELVCGEDGYPAKFESEEQADSFLRQQTTAAERRQYRWTLFSAAKLKQLGHPSPQEIN